MPYPLPVQIERHRQRHGRRAKQKVDELRAGEVGGIGGAGQQQEQHQQGDRQCHRVEDRSAATASEQPLSGQVNGQGEGEPQQRRGGQVHPDVDENPIHRVVLHAANG